MKRGNLEDKFRIKVKPLFVKFGNVIVFCLLATVLVVLIVNNRMLVYAGVDAWMVNLPVAVVLLAENAVKIWALKSYQPKIACYVLDILCLMTLTIFSDGMLISILYIVILSEFYLNQQKLKASIAVCVTSIGLFLITFAVSGATKEGTVSLGPLITSAFNDLIIFVLHFFIFNFALQIYKKNKELNEAVENLNKSNEKLRLAYEELQEVTALEERQRIAKDIHDIAGHSITTVIMQTEAAKLVIDTDPAEAKRRIAAANLQAKHALEELRESVHLLSGNAAKLTLKDRLTNIVHDSTDGTEIAIRADIDDVSLCDAKERFFLNTLKEGISNGLRHGGATAFYFELKETEGRIEFLLSDNGKGMEISELKEGFGLTGMHARAESLGGTLWFETEPDEGFEIHLTLPTDGGKGENQ